MEGDCTHNPEDWKNKSIKPALVATCIKLTTYNTQVCIQSLQKANTLKRTCI